MNNNLINNESGRSMVEMLGVLAVIGVLSVGGIAGYRNAMDKRAANEIINAVNKRAVVASGQLLRSTSFSLSEFESDVLGYPIGVAVAGTDWTAMQNEFAIKVENIPQKICQKVVDMGWNLPTEIYIGGTTSKNCADENNKLTFAFNNELTNKGGERLLACVGTPDPNDPNEICNGKNGKIECENGQIKCGSGTSAVCCPKGSICTAEGDTQGQCYQPTGSCATNADCESGEFCYLSGSSSTSSTGLQCYAPNNGECKSITEGEFKAKTLPEKDLTGRDILSIFVGKKYLKKTMNWWSANNWCLAHNSNLFSHSVIHGSTSELEAIGFALNESNTSGAGMWLDSGWNCGAYSISKSDYKVDNGSSNRNYNPSFNVGKFAVCSD